MKDRESNAVTFEFLGGKDVMPIGGFYGPYPARTTKDGHPLPDYISDEYFELIADCGINMITASATDYLYTPDEVLKYLELGEKYHIGIFVNDGNLVAGEALDTITVEKAEKQLNNYKHYPAFCGMHIVDEPTSTYYLNIDEKRLISRYRKAADVLQKELGQICYMNMYPVMLFDKNKEHYERYVQEFVDTLKPSVLMWDYYPYNVERDIKMEWYLWNMDIIRRTAKKYNKPFWAFVQAGAQWNDTWERFDSQEYLPNEAEFNWNLSTALAFGAKGIQYFPLLQPYHFAYAKTKEWDEERNGIIGVWGNKTRWYGYAKKCNQHIKMIDEVLMNAENEGIIVSGKLATEETKYVTCVIETGSFEQLQSVSGEAMVGCFHYRGKTALYVMNYSKEAAQSIKLCFDSEYHIRKIQGNEEMYISTKRLVLDIDAGAGVLLVIES